MPICGKSYEEELALVRQAEEELGEQKLRAYLAPLVWSVVDKYWTDHQELVSREELFQNGWNSFDFAREHYLKHVDSGFDGKDPYKFSTYFTWYIRQGVTGLIQNKLADSKLR